MEGSGSPDFRRRWQTERALLEGDDCCEVGRVGLSWFTRVVVFSSRVKCLGRTFAWLKQQHDGPSSLYMRPRRSWLVRPFPANMVVNAAAPVASAAATAVFLLYALSGGGCTWFPRDGVFAFALGVIACGVVHRRWAFAVPHQRAPVIRCAILLSACSVSCL